LTTGSHISVYFTYTAIVRLDGYRIRQGRYRILYTIEDAVLVVHVIKIGDRKDVYRSK